MGKTNINWISEFEQSKSVCDLKCWLEINKLVSTIFLSTTILYRYCPTLGAV